MKLVGVITILGAPAPALAQTPGLASIAKAASAPAMVQAPAKPSAAAPVTAVARRAVTAAAFQKAGQKPGQNQAPRRLNLTVRGDRFLQDDIELRQKDAWTDDEGFQLRATKVAYTRRF